MEFNSLPKIVMSQQVIVLMENNVAIVIFASLSNGGELVQVRLCSRLGNKSVHGVGPILDRRFRPGK